MVARSHQWKQGDHLGGVAGGGAGGAAAAFEGGDAFLQHRHRGVGQAAVDIAEGLQIEQRGGVVGVLENISGGLVNRRRAGAGHRIGGGAGMHRQGFDTVEAPRPAVGGHWCLAGGDTRHPAFGGNHPGIEAVPAQFAEQAAKLDLRTAVHDHFQAGRLGAGGGVVVAHLQLHPHHFGANLGGLVGEGAGGVRGAENIDHVDRHRNFGEVAIDRFAQNLLADRARVHRDHPIALLLQVFHGEIAGPIPILTGPDHGDGFHRRQDVADVIVAVVAVDNGGRARIVFGHGLAHSSQVGGRLSIKAVMPSTASAASMFSAITWPV